MAGSATTGAQARGRGYVRQPGEGQSFWQPVPANGYAEVLVNEATTGERRFAMGIQVVAPGGHVRLHCHGANEEIIFFFEGSGRAVVDGVEHAAVPGTTCYLGPDVMHSFINDGDGPLKFVWVMSPPGLEAFFEQIGRPRSPGEPAPAPFPRPADAERIERDTVFTHHGKPAG